MGKKRKTFSLDEDLHDELQRKDELNASAVANKLFREYLAAGKAPEAALNARLNDLDSEIESKRRQKVRIESEIERLERQRQEAEEKLRQRQERRHEPVMDVVEMIRTGHASMDQLKPDNEMVATHAEKAGMMPRLFIDEVRAELDGGEA